jgi:hypothetical protein
MTPADRSVPGLQLEQHRRARGLRDTAGQVRPAGLRGRLRVELGADRVELRVELLELGDPPGDLRAAA